MNSVVARTVIHCDQISALVREWCLRFGRTGGHSERLHAFTQFVMSKETFQVAVNLKDRSGEFVFGRFEKRPPEHACIIDDSMPFMEIKFGNAGRWVSLSDLSSNETSESLVVELADRQGVVS